MKHRNSTQLLLFSRSVVSDSLRPHEPQHGRLPCPSPIPRAYSNSCPLHRWCHQPPRPLLSPSPFTFSFPQHQGLFQRVGSTHQVVRVLEFQLQHQSSQWIIPLKVTQWISRAEDFGADFTTVQTCVHVSLFVCMCLCVCALTLLGPQGHICRNTTLFQKNN